MTSPFERFGFKNPSSLHVAGFTRTQRRSLAVWSQWFQHFAMFITFREMTSFMA